MLHARLARLARLTRLAVLGACLASQGLGPAAGWAEQSPAGLGELVKVLETSADPLARARAATLLGDLRDEPARTRAAEALGRALSDPVLAVRRLAAASLARAPHPGQRESLLAALARETERDVVPSLLLALGALRDARTLPTLSAWLRDPQPGVRAAALTALADVGGAEARTRLLAALTDPGGGDPAWSVRAAALLGLARVGAVGDVGPALVALREGGGWSHWLARCALAEAVPRIDAEPVRLLEHLVHDDDARVAVTAAAGLARSGHAPRLLALLGHAAPGVRAAAAGACAQEGQTQAAATLLALARTDADLGVRWSAGLALFRLGAPEGDEAVLAGLGSSEPAIWVEALAALAQRTGEQHGRDPGAWRGALARARPRARRT